MVGGDGVAFLIMHTHFGRAPVQKREALAVERGGDFLGQSVLQGGAIYVTGEGQGGLIKRIGALASQMELTSDSTFLYVNAMPRMLDPQQVADFIAALKLRTANWAVPIRVICFDTLNTGLVGGAENESKDVALLLAADARIKLRDPLGTSSRQG